MGHTRRHTAFRPAAVALLALFGCATVLSPVCGPSARGQMLGQSPSTQQQSPQPVAPVERSAPAYPAPVAPGYAPPAAVAPGYAPNFDAVLTSDASQTSFTFDRNMLAAADSFFAEGDPETRRVLAGLNSVTVRNFHARDFARYDPGVLAMIDQQYRAAGWKHLVNANGKGSATMTDLWLHFAGANITNVMVLSRGDRNMSLISVDCTLRPLDLLHLSGHFGIPKVDESAVMVPAH